MIRKPFLLKIYEAASMQRWNDQIRTVDLTELDKQAHKMIIAYVLGKCEEPLATDGFSWIEIIEGGIFEFLQRIVLTDLKPPLFHRIKEDIVQYQRLNEWVYTNIYPLISPLGENFCQKFKTYLSSPSRNVNRRIISAAHFYATKWEFNIIKRANPDGYLIDEIEQDLNSKQKRYSDLASMQKLLNDKSLMDFINISGQLRFQIRWGHLHREPKTSVIGHMLVVAILAYLFSLEITNDAKRCINNYMTGLFHDLPEVLTRDIINPVKKSVEGLNDLIKEYERDEMERKIYKLLPTTWHEDIKMFTEEEFSNLVSPAGKILRDGELLKATDELAAFIEIYLALKNGIQSETLKNSKYNLMEKYRTTIISNISFNQLYADFD